MQSNPTPADGNGLSIIPGDRILGNVLSLSGGDVISRLIAFAGTAYIARKLGPAGFGIVGFALALRSYLALVTTGGSNVMAMREVARRPGSAAKIAASVILVRLLLACLAFGAMALIAVVIDKPLATKLVIVLASLSFLTLAIDTSWVYKGLERTRPVAISLIVAQTLFLILVLLFVRGEKDVAVVPVAQFIGDFIAAAALALMVLRKRTLKVDFTEGWRVMRSSRNVLVNKILRTLIINFDVLLLGLLLGEKAVGQYVAPYRFCFMLLSIAVAIHVSYLPTLARAAEIGLDALAGSTARALAFSTAIGAPLIVGGMAEARPLLQLIFGAEYVSATPAFRLLILSIGINFLNGHLANVFLVRDQTAVLTWIIAPATAINILLNFLLIPAWGIAGAAASTVVAEGSILVTAALVLRARGVHLRWSAMWRPVFAAAVMGVALLGLRNWEQLWLSVAVGAAVYTISLVLLRGIPEDIRLGLSPGKAQRPNR